MPSVKALLRETARQKRASLTRACRARAAQALPAFLADILRFCAAFNGKPGAALESFALYWPIAEEMDSRPLIAALRRQNKKILLPALLKHDKLPRYTMLFRAFAAGQKLRRGAFGLYEPEATEPAEAETPSAVLLPLLAYDARGNRLGYGGGYYDRAIADLRRRGINPPLIGLSYQAQEEPVWQAEAHDIALHAVLTENGLRIF